MSKGIIGKKLGMTQVFAEDGSAVGVTAVEVEPSVVLQVKTKEKDGYDAVQLGYGRVKQKNTTKPIQGHCNKANKGYFRFIREFPVSAETYAVGQEITAEIFKTGDYVDVVGTSKGKGFQGVVKRHKFAGGPATHGSMSHRAPGSIGSTDAARVFKGRRMGGHMGNKKVTVQNLRIVKIIPEENLLLIRGAVPGYSNNYVIIKKV